MKERVISVGKPIPLVGILTEPDQVDPSRPAVIIFNSGIMHHIGTCRLSVKLARELAEQGFSSIRFDFSGIGDSEPRLGSLSFAESAPMEAAEIMDFLQKRRGINQFILYGLCSGADAAYETAQIDKRVVAICQIDSYTYRTKRWYWHHYGARALKLGPWYRFFKRNVAALFGRHIVGKKIADIDEEFIEMPSYIRVHPPREEVAGNIRSLLAKGIEIYNIFTESAGINYQTQYTESMGLKPSTGKIKVDLLMDAEHILPEPHYQRLVVERIASWVHSVTSVRN